MNEFDNEQKKAVNARINSVVSAGAGSGKTAVLSSRFLKLVEEGFDGKNPLKVDEILTLTFTKKATTEMYGRIYQKLCEDSEKNPFAKKAASSFSKASIQTLDSYCASLARDGCRNYGISPDFIQDGEELEKQIRQMALPFVLEHKENKALKELLGLKDYQKKAEELFSSIMISSSRIARPIDFKGLFKKQKKDAIKFWNRNIEEITFGREKLIKIYNEEEQKKKSKFTEYIENVILRTEVPEELTLDENTDVNKIAGNILPYFKKIFSFGKYAGEKNEKRNINQSVENNRITLTQIMNYFTVCPLMTELLPLLEEFQEKVMDFKRSSGILSFADVSSLAISSLRDNPKLRRLEKEKYKAIMIDEFQDNNELQKDLLFLLAEKTERMEKSIPEEKDLCKEKLFFVGDEKQSIYLFRGADVSVFRDLSKTFEKGNIELKTNYRSEPALIAAFNTIFGGIPYPLSEEENELPSVFYNEKTSPKDVPSYEAVYHEVFIPPFKTLDKDGKSISEEELFQPRIHVTLFNEKKNSEEENSSENTAENVNSGQENEDTSDAKKNEFIFIARKIKELTSKDENGNSAFRPSDIAILLKNYSNLPLLERILLNEGVPYSSEVIKGFFNDGPVNDIYAALRTACCPEDTLAYASLLRSPFVGLSQLETQSVLASNLNPFENLPEGFLSEESEKRYKSFGNFFLDFCKKAEIESLTKSISKLWYERGYRYETLWNSKVEMYESSYDRLFEAARLAQEKSMSLEEFTDSLKSYMEDSVKVENLDVPLERGECISIMSIAKSKGLEFPVVFLCDIEKTGMNDRNDKAIFFDEEYGPVMNTPEKLFIKTDSSKEKEGKKNYFFELSKKDKKNKEGAELRRVAYVALTRAKDTVFITGTVKKEIKDPSEYLPGGKKQPGSILQVLSPLFEFYKEKEKGSPFTFQEKDFLEKEKEENRGRSNTERSKNIFKDQIEGFYKNACVVKKEKEELLYISPSHLYEKDDESPSSPLSEYKKESAIKTPEKTVPVKIDRNLPYSEISEIIEGSRTKKADDTYGDPRFSYSDFGSLAHSYLEALIKGEEKVSIKSANLTGLEGNEKKTEKILAACKKMQEGFKDHSLGKKALASEWKKAEYSFRCKIGKKIVKGTIDLVFKNEEGSPYLYTIVDYKTNSSMQSELYFNQLACYRKAISQILGVEDSKIECKLFFLRFNEEKDITKDVDKVDLEKAIEECAEKVENKINE